MHAFDVLGDPVRRHLIELLARGELSAGELSDEVRARFGISQPAVSQHLKVLREAGFVAVRPEGARRLYSVQPEPLREVDDWLVPFRHFWEPKLWALGTEISRGKKARRSTADKEEQ
ncbi:ArsR family transcriptional regulator [Tsukamurella pulmonis]|uniref:DNA-binding transcriptional regulator, ArsR family n=1 Tax=Tsukamurella pulmonis TaxID=47312 RepID=A0A1H1B3L9_9ACTN|nr:metalloregulator ArsR/SmtB family transcription factor [Tsukamurella pulmonis]KXO94166.1 ArsR family transcriptional regulator [Tsukamurella pulmonis]SDQ46371.1 DNA-binding transcriptional regulator, ArsR family [Tsukamurella pulmonis]SUP25705.1 Biofilm growth-associated repressor [Tsukamurella pulmonis]